MCLRMPEIKRFRIVGEIKKGRARIPFDVEFNSMKEEHAIERLYAEMGSRHRARQFEIKIAKVEQVKEETPEAEA